MEIADRDTLMVVGVAAGTVGIYLILGVQVFALLSTVTPSTGNGAGLLAKLANEPVRVRTAILAAFAVAGSFGLPVSDVQQAAIVAAVLAILAIFSETTRAKVTPAKKVENLGYVYDPETGRWRDADGRFVRAPQE